jgi:hypothetical protein
MTSTFGESRHSFVPSLSAISEKLLLNILRPSPAVTNDDFLVARECKDLWSCFEDIIKGLSVICKKKISLLDNEMKLSLLMGMARTIQITGRQYQPD